MGSRDTKYKCPLDGSLLFFDRGEGNDAYICPECNTIYPTLSEGEAGILRDIESQAFDKLNKYLARLTEIRKEEEKINKILEFAKKDGLLSKLNKANLSAETPLTEDEKFLKKATDPRALKYFAKITKEILQKPKFNKK